MFFNSSEQAERALQITAHFGSSLVVPDRKFHQNRHQKSESQQRQARVQDCTTSSQLSRRSRQASSRSRSEDVPMTEEFAAGEADAFTAEDEEEREHHLFEDCPMPILPCSVKHGATTTPIRVLIDSGALLT